MTEELLQSTMYIWILLLLTNINNNKNVKHDIFRLLGLNFLKKLDFYSACLLRCR